jgi:hypothetical protein
MVTRKRDMQIAFRVTNEEKKIIDEKVKLSKMTKSEFFISTIMNGKIVITDEKEKLKSITNLTNEINKIGTNINQVSKHVNQIGSIGMDDFEYLRKRMDDIWQLLKLTL